MKNFFNKFPVSLVVLLLSGWFIQPLSAQDRTLEETLQMLSGDAAGSYLKPISSAFGSNLNGGWFHRAPKPVKFGLNFEVGVVAMGSVFPTSAQSFDTNGKFRFRQAEAEDMVANIALPQNSKDALVEAIISKDFTVGIKGATIIGESTNHLKVYFPEQDVTFVDPNTSQTVTQTVAAYTYELPFGGFGDLAAVNVLPLVSPQLTIGTVMGTQVTLRFLPSVQLNDDLGEFKYLGFGIQHNPGAWLAIPLPVDLAGSFYHQTLTIGELFESNTNSFGLNASKQFGFRMLNVTPYAGFMLEQSVMTVTYDLVTDSPGGGQTTVPVKFDLTGENKSRLTLGLNLRLLLMNLNVDYNIGKYNSVTAGLMVAI